MRGRSGAEYEVETLAFWDDRRLKHLRVVVSIDDEDKGWGSFSSLVDSFIISPDGTFGGE